MTSWMTKDYIKWLRQHYESSNSQLISIVLPTYNGARYLRESIESVLRQTTSEWELIIVVCRSSSDFGYAVR